MDIVHRAKEIEQEVIGWRRRIHENPELSFQENETSRFVAEKLKEFGIENIKSCGGTGVVALIEGKSEGKCIALRADMDALPVQEETGLSFASKNKGVAHACGHDIHTAVLLGTAKLLQESRENFKGTVKLIFQPAEENLGGAASMIRDGVLENPKPEGIVALHCWPDQEAGKIFYRDGKVCAASDRFKIVVEGKQGHAAHPHKSVDPTFIAGHIICGIQGIVSRETSPLESAVISIGTINAGTVENIIPQSVEIKGSIRSLLPEVREHLHQRLEEIAVGTALAHRGKAAVEIKKGTPPMVVDKELSDFVYRAISKNLGSENIVMNPYPSMGSEDFSFYSEIIPGAMFRIGCGFPGEYNPPLHSPQFRANEECLKTGVAALASVAIDFLNDV